MLDNNNKHALFVYADQHPLSSSDHGFRITRISLAGLRHKSGEKIRGQEFDYVLLMDGLTRDDLRGTNDGYKSLCLAIAAKRAPIISDHTTIYPMMEMAKELSAAKLGATFNHDPAAVERAS